jgi:putative DNA primase/helicase
MESVLPESNSIWDAARSYASNGIYVNPVYVSRGPDGKKIVKPVGLWRKTSSNSFADIGAWQAEHPNAGLLIDCGKSNLVVADCDGQEGVANWLALDPPVPLGIVDTPNGEHWYYRAHPDHPIGNDQDGKVAPHVDVRGLGGFVFAPPSSDGQKSWRWRDAPYWDGITFTVPQIVIERMKAKLTDGANRVLADVDDSPFDDVPRLFTTAEATAFIKEAKAKLAGARSGFNGAINNFAMACAHFPWLVDRELCAALVIRTLQPVTGWTEPDHADRATINSAYSATEAGRSWVAARTEESASAGPVMAAGADPGEEALARTLPPPARPLDVARELKGLIPHTDGVAHRAWWQGDFYRWTGAHWEAEEQASVEKWLYRQTGDATYQVPDKQTEKQKADGEKPTFTDMPWAPTRKKIGDLAHALGVGELQREGEEDRGVLAVANGVIEGRELVRHSPARFNLFSLPFDYEPAAVCPSWLAFLDQVLPDDKEAQEFLAEWFGYVISGRTEQHKMAALIGKKRSGKGTIARVLSALVGKGNVSGLNLGLLSGTFGLEPFVGSALAVASDVRWHSRAIGDAVQILLEVSGEDHVTVSRKNRPAWKGTLGVRFMLMSNDTPTFSDRSGALVDRMLYVAFRQSFYGREDTGLTGKLMGELPGILNWALDGLDRLNARGRFTQPESGRGEQESTRRLADPIGAFIEDWCIVGPGQEIELDHLFLKYQNWCEGEGRKRDSTTKEIFSRDLRSKIDDLAVDRVRVNGKRTRILKGISSEAV